MERNTEQFWERVMEKFFTDEIGELEYGDFLELGEECGLLITEIYDPDKHGEMVGDPEKGDTIYLPVPRP